MLLNYIVIDCFKKCLHCCLCPDTSVLLFVVYAETLKTLKMEDALEDEIG